MTRDRVVDQPLPASGRETIRQWRGAGKLTEQGCKHSGTVSIGKDPREPDDGSEDGNGDGLLEDFHPCAGAREDACPCGLQGERDVGCGEAEGEGGEDGEGDERGLGERVTEGDSHERGGAWSGDDDGEDSGEEAAGVALLLSKRTAGAGEGEADFKLSGEREAEEEEQRGHQ